MLSAVKGVFVMRLKITEHNGAFMVSVLGSRQELVICDGSGGLEVELRELESGRVWWEEPGAFGPEVVEQGVQPVASPVVGHEVQPVASPVVRHEVRSVASPVVGHEVQPGVSPVVRHEVQPVASPVVRHEVRSVTSPVVGHETQLVTLPVVDPAAAMFTKLAILRKEIASAQGLPPYIIFHDKSLWAMIEAMPQSLEAFGKISGVGRAKLEKYGERFLAVINGAAA